MLATHVLVHVELSYFLKWKPTKSENFDKFFTESTASGPTHTGEHNFHFVHGQCLAVPEAPASSESLEEHTAVVVSSSSSSRSAAEIPLGGFLPPSPLLLTPAAAGWAPVWHSSSSSSVAAHTELLEQRQLRICEPRSDVRRA